MWTYFLYKQIVFQHFSGFHNSYNGCLDVHLPVLIHSTPSLFYFLHKQNTTHFISISLHYSYIILLLHGQSHPLCLLFSSVTSTYLCLNIFFYFSSKHTINILYCFCSFNNQPLYSSCLSFVFFHLSQALITVWIFFSQLHAVFKSTTVKNNQEMPSYKLGAPSVLYQLFVL